ncbi:MAG TPA: hypothetical protein VLJ18_08245 [Thermoanaerobaculia bacterium]|nr:hypothetical protein [Thermoanaerobaculia bacterium]
MTEAVPAAREVRGEAQQPARAVLVVHGMGQQVRFQGLDQVAQGLLRETGGDTRNPVARTVKIGDETYQRLELFLPLPGGGEREVHVYEAYWAPITEGQVTLRDVTAFLFGAVLNGVRNLGGALRYSFGRASTIWPPFSSVIALGSSFGVLLTLVAMNGALLALAALNGLQPGFVSDSLKAHLTEGEPALLAILAAFSLATLALLLVLAGAGWVKRRTARVRLDGLWHALGAVLQALFLVWLSSTLLAGFAVAVLVSGFGPAPWLRDALSCPWLAKHWMLPLVALLLASAAVRRLFVQYLGDVAAYVTSYKLDRFNEVRQRIKEIARKTAAALYEATEDPGSRKRAYDGVAVVAHSLGSVVAYDALNALLVDDVVSAEKRDVSERTRLFLTFGSPLEKTAFLFASQARRTTDAREALVAALQPLISDYGFRPFPWINVFSRRDPISGRLVSYDDSSQPLYRERRIRNLPDRDAVLPLLAHLEYFSDAVMVRQLVRALR